MSRRALPALLTMVLLFVQGLAPAFAARMQGAQLGAHSARTVALTGFSVSPCHEMAMGDEARPDAAAQHAEKLPCCADTCRCPDLCSNPAVIGISLPQLCMPPTHFQPQSAVSAAPTLPAPSGLLRPPCSLPG